MGGEKKNRLGTMTEKRRCCERAIRMEKTKGETEEPRMVSTTLRSHFFVS